MTYMPCGLAVVLVVVFSANSIDATLCNGGTLIGRGECRNQDNRYTTEVGIPNLNLQQCYERCCRHSNWCYAATFNQGCSHSWCFLSTTRALFTAVEGNILPSVWGTHFYIRGERYSSYDSASRSSQTWVQSAAPRLNGRSDHCGWWCYNFTDHLKPPPTGSPVTSRPTQFPSASPTLSHPTRSPLSSSPTRIPSLSPSQHPTTSVPSLNPTTHSPTSAPTTSVPTRTPTESPTMSPTIKPTTSAPTGGPSQSPTVSPTSLPSGTPTLSPTISPTSSSPSSSPTLSNPTSSPSAAPTTPFVPDASTSSGDSGSTMTIIIVVVVIIVLIGVIIGIIVILQRQKRNNDKMETTMTVDINSANFVTQAPSGYGQLNITSISNPVFAGQDQPSKVTQSDYDLPSNRNSDYDKLKKSPDVADDDGYLNVGSQPTDSSKKYLVPDAGRASASYLVPVPGNGATYDTPTTYANDGSKMFLPSVSPAVNVYASPDRILSETTENYYTNPERQNVYAIPLEGQSAYATVATVQNGVDNYASLEDHVQYSASQNGTGETYAVLDNHVTYDGPVQPVPPYHMASKTSPDYAEADEKDGVYGFGDSLVLRSSSTDYSEAIEVEGLDGSIET